MFTGIVETKGTLEEKIDIGGDCRLVINTGDLSLENCHTGDSISVSGACLTVAEIGSGGTTAYDLSRETLDLTWFEPGAPARPCNLERSLRLGESIRC